MKDTLQKLCTTQKRGNMQNTAEQNYTGLVASYETQPGNEVGSYSTELPSTHGASSGQL